MHFAIFRRCGGALLCAALVAALLVSPASAAGDTLTLSGEISGEYRVPEGVTKVVLDGVRAMDLESGVVLPASAEVELAAGTENVAGIFCMGDLRIIGGGSLVGGAGIYAQGNLTLDLTGTIVLEGGMIVALGGDLTVNSGTIRMQSLDGAGEGTIGASGGDVVLNGGDIVVRAKAVGISAGDGSIVVDQADVDVSGDQMAMLARQIVLPAAAGESLEIQKTDGEASGEMIMSGAEPAKRVQISKKTTAAEAEPGAPAIVNGKADAGAAVTLGERPDDAATVEPRTEQDAPVDPFAWIAAGVAAVLGIAIMIVVWKKKK